MGPGTYAEYVCLPEESGIVIKPTNMTYDEAAAIPFSAYTALFFLRDTAKVQPGQKVLINGASGAVGVAAIQIARHFGAEVTGVCSNTNLELVKSLGADKVIDYTKEDFTKSGQTYDVIFDTVNKSSFVQCKGALTQKGIFMPTFPTLVIFLQMVWTSLVGGKKARWGVGDETATDLTFIKELCETEKLKSVIDRTYPLEQMVEAHRYVDTGRKKGNVVITVAHNNKS